tara:strand:- start:52 stop:366 length:315 start_codon:yes stop_codon:yes gene_type:complete
MKYYKAIVSLFVLNILVIIFVLYFANISRDLERDNLSLKNKIAYMQDQININEIEYTLYNSYDYLQKMQKIYFSDSNSAFVNHRINFAELQTKNIENFYTIGTK